MKKIKYGAAAVWLICSLLLVFSFFATDFVLYDFHMENEDYRLVETEQEKPSSASTRVWFTFGPAGRQIEFGLDADVPPDDLEILSDTGGHYVARLPAMTVDGTSETVYDYARVDYGSNAFNPAPQRFGGGELPFELVFAERKYIMVYYQDKILTGAEIQVTSHTGERKTYITDSHGWLPGLPNRDIREGFTAAFSPDGATVYRMHYRLEDYPCFSPHFTAARRPLMRIFLLTAIGIAVVQLVRGRWKRRDPAYAIYSRERPGVYPYTLRTRTSSRFLLIRWLCLFSGMFLWTFAGRLIHQGQVLNEISIPVFSCPFNLDQVVEVPCYYLSHLPFLFNRFGAEFPARNIRYAAIFLATTAVCFVFLGRILCGFLCPAGLLQDMLDKLRQALHIRPIPVNDRMNKILQPLKWVWILLFLGFVFVGGDFCNICPLKVYTTSQGGYWTNLYLGGFLAVVMMVCSFFIKRFWCIICPMGYLMGLFYRFNLFKLKKDCTACTECGACYEACPMRLKNIYTERDQSNVQTVDCLVCGECIHKCPENNALRLTFCGKDIYKSSRKTFISKYAPERPKASAEKE